jgi:amino acid transporter
MKKESTIPRKSTDQSGHLPPTTPPAAEAPIPESKNGDAWQERARRWVFGAPRDLHDPSLFHKISLIAFLAWVGMGADGLSSAAYGPEEAYKKLGTHTELAIFLALATLLTVVVISYTYSHLIEHFPSGGGGYVVATKLLGTSFGVVSGCALLVDYALTISTSVASGVDASFSFLPMAWQDVKVPVEALFIGGLVVLNLRGVKESVKILVPIFLLFVITHVVLILGAFFTHGSELPQAAAQVRQSLQAETLGGAALFLLFLRAYSYGAGTFTGIEAVSNGLQIMREPKVRTAKRTMIYMGASLALTAGGILVCYMLINVHPEEGKTLNAVLAERVQFGSWFSIITLLSETGLLIVAAQTGFIDGPRVMANMALDSWFPHRFSSLSERLTMHYGVLLMGFASVATLLYTHGDITTLVTMYSINVFVTFTLSHMGMVKLAWHTRRTTPRVWVSLPIFMLGLVMCAGILTVVVVEKFEEGAWVTLAVTLALITLCYLIRRHYRGVVERLNELSADLSGLPQVAPISPPAAWDLTHPTAVLLVGSFGGVGLHSLLSIPRLFPRHFHQVIFVSVAVVDSGNFKGTAEVNGLEQQVQDSLDKYVAAARGLGLSAKSIMGVGHEPVAVAEDLCQRIAKEHNRAVFFAGKLIFEREHWYQRLLHNETAYAIQRRLQWDGLPMVVLPVRVQDASPRVPPITAASGPHPGAA